jgi:hypothetical protein
VGDPLAHLIEPGDFSLALREPARTPAFEGSVCLAALDDLGYCFFPRTFRVFLKISLHLFLKVGGNLDSVAPAQLALDQVDKLTGGKSVQFDTAGAGAGKLALAEQEIDFVFGAAAFLQLFPLVAARLAGLGKIVHVDTIKLQNVVKPQADIDDINLIFENISAGVFANTLRAARRAHIGFAGRYADNRVSPSVAGVLLDSIHAFTHALL